MSFCFPSWSTLVSLTFLRILEAHIVLQAVTGQPLP